MEGTEGLFGPDVEAAFFREARGELVDDERAGDEEEDGGKDPEADRGGAVMAGGGDPARADDSGDIKEENVPEAHGLAELGFGGVGGDGHHALACGRTMIARGGRAEFRDWEFEFTVVAWRA